MRHEPLTRPGLTFGETVRRVIITLIEQAPNDAEKKARILIAREHGHLSDREAEAWIVADGLEEA